MVNFPSRPNLRPVDPPPLGASVRHACSLPHPGPRPRASALDACRAVVGRRRIGCFGNKPSIKAKTPAIVPNQGSSSLIKATAKISMTAPIRQPATSNRHPSPEFPLGDFATPRLCVKARHQVTIKAQSRQKTPVIVHDQGKSRHSIKTTRAPSSPATKWRYAAESWHRACRCAANPSAATGRAPGELFQTRAGSTAPAPSTALWCD